MRIPFLFLSVMLAAVSASAQASLCNPAWLAGASGAAVQAQIRAGADVDQTCNRNRNRPLHQAILTPTVGPDVFQALVGAGADTQARNIDGATPADYAVNRWQRASGSFREGSAAYRREFAIYTTLVRGGEAEYGAASDAQNQLCDPNWWRSSANASSVRALLGRPGVDPEARCNQNNDRPLHLALRWETFPNLPPGVKDAVLTLAASGASLGARNNTGRSPLALAEIRYDRYLARAMRTRPAWCQGGAADPDLELYLGVRSLATGEPRQNLATAVRRDSVRRRGRRRAPPGRVGVPRVPGVSRDGGHARRPARAGPLRGHRRRVRRVGRRRRRRLLRARQQRVGRRRLGIVAQPRLLADQPPSGRVRELARRAAVRVVAEPDDGGDVSSADRGGMGQCGGRLGQRLQRERR